MDVARKPGLMRRGTRWWLRVRVPDDVLEVVGRREIWRSLRISDYGEAVRRCRAARVELDEHFERVRRARRGLPAGDEGRRLVAVWLRDRARANADDDLALHGEALEHAAREAEVDLDRLRHGEELAPSVRAAVDRLLVEAGLPAREHHVGPIGAGRRVADVDTRLPEHAELRALVRRAMVEEQRRRLDRLGGRPAEAADPAVAVHPCATGGGVTLDQLVERFVADRGPALRDKTVGDYEVLFRALRELWGPDRPVREVTREDCRRVRDLFESLPANAEERYPGVALSRVAERARERGVAP